ncbi:hypothetical protein TWF281_005885 [Arthrobotrys megalospora]
MTREGPIVQGHSPRSHASATRGSLSFDFSKGVWTPCMKTSPKGLVTPPSAFPEFEYLRGDIFRHFIDCTGKLTNEREGISQSGFWVEGGYFVTSLHFGPWICHGERPTQDMLETYRKSQDYGFNVSRINHNITGRREDDEYVDVVLWTWNLDNDLALFYPTVRNGQSPPSMIPSRCLVEADDLFHYFDRVNGTSMYAVGYNNSPDRDLGDYLRKYITDSPAANGAVPDYDTLLWPHFKSVAVGTIHDLDFLHSELLLNCSAWKGFFGGLIAIRYPQPDGAPLVIGQVVGARGDERFNRGRLLPTGFRDFFKNNNFHKERPGEMGLGRINLSGAHIPQGIVRPPRRPMMQPGLPGAHW